MRLGVIPSLAPYLLPRVLPELQRSHPELRLELHETRTSTLLTELEMRELERKNTLLALEMAEWRVSGPNGAAKLLGVKPTTLTDRMKKFELRKPS